MEISILQSGRGSRHWAGTSSWRLPHLTCLRQPSQDEIIALSVELAPLRSTALRRRDGRVGHCYEQLPGGHATSSAARDCSLTQCGCFFGASVLRDADPKAALEVIRGILRFWMAVVCAGVYRLRQASLYA